MDREYTASEVLTLLRDSIDAFKFHGEHKALTVVDYIKRNTMDPRPMYSHLPFSFKGHEWQEDVLNDMNPLQATQKCSQIGISEVYIRKSMALCGLYGLNVAYVMPTQSTIRSYVPARFDPVIQASIKLRNSIGKPDNSEHKYFNNGANLYIRHSNSQAVRISIALDAVLMDEYDRCDEDNYDAWPQRLGHSRYRLFQCFSTPTYSEFGINGLYLQSDRKRHLIKCSGCGCWQAMSFPDSIMFKRGLLGLPDFHMDMPQRVGVDKHEWEARYMEREPYIGCVECSKRLDRWNDKKEWVPEVTTGIRKISGRHLSRFDVPFDKETNEGHNAGSIITEFFRLNKLLEFYNQVLGLPYVQKSDSINDDDLSFACAPMDSGFNSLMDRSSGPCFMGIDQGNTLNVVVYQKRGIYFDLVHVSTISMSGGDSGAFSLNDVLVQVEDIFRRYCVQMIVVDGEPDINLPRAIASKFSGRAFWAFFVHSVNDFNRPPKDEMFKMQKAISANRSWLLNSVEQMVKRSHNESELRFPSNFMSTDIGKEVKEHFKAQIKVQLQKESRDTKIITSQTVWRRRGSRADHYLLATAYAYLAWEIYKDRFVRNTSNFVSTGTVVVRSANLL